MLSLSLSCDRASWQVYQTLKPTDSGAENIRASEQDLFLFRPLILLLTACARFRTLRLKEREPREERNGMHLIETLVLLPAGTIYRGTAETLLSCQMYYRTLLFASTKAETNGCPCPCLFIPGVNDQGFLNRIM